MPTFSGSGAAPLRLVSVNVRGRNTKQPGHLTGRSKLLRLAVEAIIEAGWSRLGAVVFPAGFLPAQLALGPLSSASRSQALELSQVGAACAPVAQRLIECTGAILVVGVDTPSYHPEFSGDQTMVAWGASGVVGLARKIFPSDGDTNEWRNRPLLIYPDDADAPGRVVKLADGSRSLLCACYDAFIFGQLRNDSRPPWPAIRFIAEGRLGWRWARTSDRQAILSRFRALIATARPTLALIGVHGFERSGREVYWQRHGIASASAGLGGGIAVGAAHFRDLPDVEDPSSGALAAVGVNRRHLAHGIFRRARRALPASSLAIAVPGSPHLAAVIRLFEFPNGRET